MSDPADYYTYDGDSTTGTAPHRPATDDLGYDDLKDLATDPPNQRTHPTSRAWNQRTQNGVGLNRMATMLKLSVTFSGGDPAVAKMAFIGNATTLEMGDLTVVDNSVGDTTVRWPADKLAPALVEPYGLTLNDVSTIGSGGAATVSSPSPGVRVVTQDIDGVAADIPFTICIG